MSDLYHYFRAIAKNKAIALNRDLRQTISLDDDKKVFEKEGAGINYDVGAKLEGDISLTQLGSLLHNSLLEPEKSIFKYRFYDQLDYVEIRKKMNMQFSVKELRDQVVATVKKIYRLVEKEDLIGMKMEDQSKIFTVSKALARELNYPQKEILEFDYYDRRPDREIVAILNDPNYNTTLKIRQQREKAKRKLFDRISVILFNQA